MMILKNIPLKTYNTFGLDYTADCLISINSEEEAVSLFSGGILLDKPFLIIGGGSNLLFINDFAGTLLFPCIKGITVEMKKEHNKVIVSAGAGVKWDDLVGWTVEKGLGGLENLSLIPGNVGASPIQNIGAYGTEVRDLIVNVRTISTEDGSLRIFSNKECEFGYRNSIFKQGEKGKYLVTRVFFELSEKPILNLTYGTLKEEVSAMGEVNVKNVRQAVINIRRRKLPDPEIIGNAGSFFKNPVVSNSVADRLKNEYPDMPLFSDAEGHKKLASGWLIDQCGWKGRRIGNAGVHDKQALVIINYGNASGSEIYNLSEKVRQSVQSKFGVLMEREVELVGTI